MEVVIFRCMRYGNVEMKKVDFVWNVPLVDNQTCKDQRSERGAVRYQVFRIGFRLLKAQERKSSIGVCRHLWYSVGVNL